LTIGISIDQNEVALRLLAAQLSAWRLDAGEGEE
jgi:hypothetical protein